MSKEAYLDLLNQKLLDNEIPGADQMVDFYAEMIEDRMEDGMTEEEAVATMEDVDSIVEHAKADRPITELVTARVKESHENAVKKGHGTLWMVLAIIGFPVWFPLMVAFFAVLLSVYIVLWAVVGTLYVVEFAFGISAAACFVFGFGVLFGWIPIATTLVGWGLALVLGGLFLLLWHPICALAGALIRLIKATFRKIKGVFAKPRT